MSETEGRDISAKVFVGNLNYDTTSKQLSDHLAEAGEIVDVFLPTDRATGRPRGFAFVEFGSDGEAEAAIQRFDGTELDGRNLRINAADDRPRRAPSGAPRGGDSAPFQDPPWENRGKPKGSRRRLRSRKRSL